MYKTILFDFDGTVFNTGEGIIKSVQYAARAFGFPADDCGALRCFIGPPLRATFMKFFGVDGETAGAMTEKYRERYSVEGLRECSPYPGVPELVRQLRAAGRTVCVATGKPTVFTRRILDMHGLSELFDDVLGSEFDGTRSEKSEVVSELLARWGGPAVMVGDRDNDVLGAAGCAIPCIGVAWGFAEPGELEGAGAISVAGDTAELGALLLG